MSTPIARNPILGTVVVVIFATAAVLTNMRGGDTKVDNRIWYYDLGTNQLYAAPSTTLPPGAAPSGAEGVVAVVMGCGDCGGETFTAYLQTYSDDYRKALDAGGDIPPKVMMNGTLIRTVDSETWLNIESPEGRAIVTGATVRCGAATPTRCMP